MRELLARAIAELERLRLDVVLLREELRWQRRRDSTRERTIGRNRRIQVAAIKPNDLDVERAKRILRRQP